MTQVDYTISSFSVIQTFDNTVWTAGERTQLEWTVRNLSPNIDFGTSTSSVVLVRVSDEELFYLTPQLPTLALAPGSDENELWTIWFDPAELGLTPGDYAIAPVANDGFLRGSDFLLETDYDNNYPFEHYFTYVADDGPPPPPEIEGPDLRVDSLVSAQNDLVWQDGSFVSLSYTVTNYGTERAAGSLIPTVYTQFVLSPDDDFYDDDNIPIASDFILNGLNAGESKTESVGFFSNPTTWGVPSGTYYLGLVADYIDPVFDPARTGDIDEGDYERNNHASLQVTIVAPEPPPPPQDDYTSNDPGDLPVGSSLAGAIQFAEDEDYFDIALTAGETYTFILTSDTGATDPLTSATLFVYFGNAQEQVSVQMDATTGQAVIEQFTPLQTGTYFVDVVGDGVDLGAYTISGTLYEEEPQPPADDFPDSNDTTGVVTIDGSATGVLETGGDRDWFAVSLIKDQIYTFDLEGAETNAGTLDDPMLRLFDPTGDRVRSNDDGGAGYNARIADYVAPFTGTFFLEARTPFEEPDDVGSYTLSAKDVTPPPVTDVPGDTSTTTYLNVGQAEAGQLGLFDDVDAFWLSMAAGQRYRVTVTATDGDPQDVSVRLELIEFGTLAGIDLSTGAENSFEFSAPESFEGLIVVEASGAPYLGDYTLLVEEIATAAVPNSATLFSFDLSGLEADVSSSNIVVDETSIMPYGHGLQFVDTSGSLATDTGAYTDVVYVARDGERILLLEDLDPLFGTVLVGTEHHDHLLGGNGLASLEGLGGHDVLDVRFSQFGFVEGGLGDDYVLSASVVAESGFFTRDLARAGGIIPPGGADQLRVLHGGTIEGSAADDGCDVLDYSLSAAGIRAELHRDRVIGEGLRDTVVSFEKIIATEYRDVIVAAAHTIEVWAGAGDDILRTVGNVDSTMYGEDGADRIITKGGADVIEAGNDDDLVRSGGGDDETLLGDGDDVGRFGSGDDSGCGGDGEDRLFGNGGDDDLCGGDDDDRLFGGQGADVLNGGSGNDALRGGNGRDVLIGGLGDDTLYGGNDPGGDESRDTFVFTVVDNGADRIKDFENGKDLIDLSEFGLASFADVLDMARNAGSQNLVLDFGYGDKVVIENFRITDLDASDVILV